jgi:hypothetical protein
MAINPESLLIFGGGKTEEQSGKGKKKKNAEKEGVLSRGEGIKQLPKFSPDKGTEPVFVEPQRQTQSATAQQAKPARQQEKPQQAPQPRPMRTSLFGDSSLRPSEERGRVSESSIYSDEEIALNREPEAFHEPPSSLVKEQNAAQAKRAAIKMQQQSREAAKGKTCAWHPWREAYATCGYCNRYFCFQDIVEFNRNYYCLDDIDNVSSKFAETAASKGNNLGLVSGVFLMISFLVFFFYANAQIIYILQYMHNVGISFFLAHVDYTYVLALLEGAFAALALVSALLLFVRSPKGFYIGVFACLGAVALFSYQYTGTATVYLGIVDILMFGAFAMLLYSRTSYIPEEVKNPISSLGRNTVNWPNVGQF